MTNTKEKKNQKPAEETIETVLNVRRVSKVVKGGRRFAFSALVVVGDGHGSVGIALGKGREVAAAISKGLRRAKKSMFIIPLYKTTIPFTVQGKYGASNVLIRSASKGTGVIAGGAMRAVLESVGVKDVLAKSKGSSNPHSVVKATIDALTKMRDPVSIAQLRGVSLNTVFNG